MTGWIAPTSEEIAMMREASRLEAIRQEQEAALRRSHARVALRANISLSSESNLFVGMTENISEGGVFVSTLSPPAVGAEVTLLLQLDEAEPIPLSGEVRWHRTDDDGNSTGCGVRFRDLEASAITVLERALKNLPKEPLLYDV